MKSLKHLSCAAFVFALASATPLLADPVTPTLFVDGSSALLVATNVGGVQQYTYSDIATNIFGTRTTNFLATYSNVAGIDVLNVTDVCAQVNILVGATAPCQQVAFIFTDISHTNASFVSLLGTANGAIDGNIAAVVFGASIGGGSASIDYTGVAPTSTTPEPGSLALLATGLFGVAGAARKRIQNKS